MLCNSQRAEDRENRNQKSESKNTTPNRIPLYGHWESSHDFQIDEIFGSASEGEVFCGECWGLWIFVQDSPLHTVCYGRTYSNTERAHYSDFFEICSIEEVSFQ